MAYTAFQKAKPSTRLLLHGLLLLFYPAGLRFSMDLRATPGGPESPTVVGVQNEAVPRAGPEKRDFRDSGAVLNQGPQS